MKTLDLNFICAALNLPQPAENRPVRRVITDSRQAQEGDLFVALAGENHDAHDFVPDVLAKGAWAVVSRGDLTGVAGCFFVPAYNQIALTIQSNGLSGVRCCLLICRVQ